MKLDRRLVGLLLALSLLFAWRLMASDMAARATGSALDVIDFGPLPGVLRESSGIAVSRQHPGVFWSNNDSGDGPRVYALDSVATLLGTFEVAGARARDWEALDLGPCPREADTSSERCLYAADIGDNARRRSGIEIYVIPEPDPADPRGTARALGAIRLTYPDVVFDAEALAVTPEGGLVISTKGHEREIYLFEVSASDAARTLSSGEHLPLAPGRRLPFDSNWVVGRTVTGGAISPDGSVLALRTYNEVYFYSWPIDGAFREAAPTCFLGRLEPQGEAVSFLPGGRLLISSESPGRAGHLLSVECAG